MGSSQLVDTAFGPSIGLIAGSPLVLGLLVVVIIGLLLGQEHSAGGTAPKRADHW